MKRRTLFAMLGLTLALAMTGCGEQQTGAAGADAEVRTQVDSETQSTEDAVKEPDFHYGDEIVIHDRDSINVENLYDLNVKEIFSGYDAVYANLTVTYNGKEYEHSVWRNEKGITEMTTTPTEVVPYVIEMPKSIIGEATIIFSERKYPEPVTLSGNPEDIYTFDDYSYCIGDKVVLYFDKDTTVSGDALVLTEQVYNQLEEMTGLKFKNGSKYSDLADYGIREPYFGFDPFNGYDYFHLDKMGVYFVHDEEGKDWISASYGRGSIVLIDGDFDYHTDAVYTLAHELAHSLDRANHDHFDRIMTEGFGSYWGSQVSRLYPEYIVREENEIGPEKDSYWYKAIGAKDAETLYNDVYDRMENSTYYEYGYNLMTYLYENYSLEEINDFYDALSEKLWERRFEVDEYAEANLKYGFLGDVSDQAFETDFIKEYWGDDFFVKFGTWVEKNRARFIE